MFQFLFLAFLKRKMRLIVRKTPWLTRRIVVGSCHQFRVHYYVSYRPLDRTGKKKKNSESVQVLSVCFGF